MHVAGKHGKESEDTMKLTHYTEVTGKLARFPVVIEPGMSYYRLVAHLVEHSPDKREVVGSNPTGPILAP